ncbi:MAG: cation transporter [Bacteroidales bacterium]|nr:cation transporter [Bacteroidales bacterium]
MKKYVLFLLLASVAFSCQYSTQQKEDKAKAETISASEVAGENLKFTTLDVKGMTCTGCENTVKKSVTELGGIIEVTASHKDGKATVEFDASKTSIEDIQKAIKNKGYDVTNYKFSKKTE